MDSLKIKLLSVVNFLLCLKIKLLNVVNFLLYGKLFHLCPQRMTILFWHFSDTKMVVPSADHLRIETMYIGYTNAWISFKKRKKKKEKTIPIYRKVYTCIHLTS